MTDTPTVRGLRSARRRRRLMHALAALVCAAFAASSITAVITDRAWPWIGSVSTGMTLLYMFVMVFPRGNASVATWERLVERAHEQADGARRHDLT